MSFLQIFAETSASHNNTFLTIFFAALGVVGVIGVIGAASAYFYKGRADALINLQEKEIAVLKDNNKTLKEQNESLRLERIEMIAELKRMRAEMKTLRGLIQQPKQFNALAKTMAEQHSAVITKLTDIAQGLIETASEKK